jgi:hypothetical protein
MGLYDGLQNAEIGEGGRYLGDLGVGRFSLRVIRMLAKQSRKSGLMTIAELEVIESSNPSEPLGQKVGWAQSHREIEIADRAIKEFVAALLGYYWPDDKERIKAELNPRVVQLMEQAVGPANIFAGKCVTSDNYEKITQRNNKRIVLPRWSPFEGEEPPARVESAPAAPAYAPPGPNFGPTYQPPHPAFMPTQQPAAPANVYPPKGPPMPAYAGAPVPPWSPPPESAYVPPEYRTPAPTPPQPVWDPARGWVLPR